MRGCFVEVVLEDVAGVPAPIRFQQSYFLIDISWNRRLSLRRSAHWVRKVELHVVCNLARANSPIHLLMLLYQSLAFSPLILFYLNELQNPARKPSSCG